MNRRHFLSASALGAAASVLEQTPGLRATSPEAQASKPKTTKRALMKLGATARCDEASLKAVLRHGIKNIVTFAPIAEEGRLYATVAELEQIRDIAGKSGVSIDVLTPPNLASSHIDRERNPAIMLGQSPQRDRDIEAVQTMIKNCAAAGIPCIKYNMSILGVLRTERIPGRGDSEYAHFKLADVKPNQPLTRAGVVNPDQYWERITYFLERVIPVATEYKVRMACHPNDSMTPPEGYQGVHAVLSTVEGLKKFVSIKESPYHGLNFCQGTVSEMLMDPGREIYDVIRYFGERKKIFMVHFRNITGNRLEFAEVNPDEGVVDLVKAMLVYRDVGYDGIITPDHPIRSTGDPNGAQNLGFIYGYISALIKAVDQLG